LLIINHKKDVFFPSTLKKGETDKPQMDEISTLDREMIMRVILMSRQLRALGFNADDPNRAEVSFDSSWL